MAKVKHEILVSFEADEEWKPLGRACWFCCPFHFFTKLTEECQCLKAYENGINICPFTADLKNFKVLS